jgi:hypothetical protein
VVVIALLGFGGAASAAEARITVKATLSQASFSSARVVVTISNSRAFTSRTRPRSVAVKYGRRTYRLWRVARPARARTAAAATSVWRSAARFDFNGLVGRRVAVKVRTGRGATIFQRRVTRPKSTFAPPGRRVTGEEAFRRIGRHFVNSSFTNCPEGWPACSSERRFNHCAGGGIDGDWRQRVLPADVTRSQDGRYHVVDAYQNPDGSWGISYQVTLSSGATGYYSWVVRTDETAIGVYAVGEDRDQLWGYRWQQPAGC